MKHFTEENTVEFLIRDLLSVYPSGHESTISLKTQACWVKPMTLLCDSINNKNRSKYKNISMKVGVFKKFINTVVLFVCGFSLQSLANAQGSPWPDLEQPSASQGGGEKDAALIVGIEDYVFAQDVPGAESNAGAWYDYLSESKKVPYIKWLKSQDGTREKMELQLEETLKQVKPGGRLWFIYIGHGAPLDGGKDGGLVGVDGQQDVLSLKSRSLSRGVLLDKIQAKKVPAVVVLDACFSGQTQSGESLVPGLQPLLPVEDVESGKVLLLTAAGSDQYAGPLPGGERPAFSYLVLGALRGWGDQNGDGKVMASEVRQYTEKTLSQLLNDRSQTPQMSGKDTVLASGRSLESGPSLGKILKGSGGSKRAPDKPEGALGQINTVLGSSKHAQEQGQQGWEDEQDSRGQEDRLAEEREARRLKEQEEEEERQRAEAQRPRRVKITASVSVSGAKSDGRAWDGLGGGDAPDPFIVISTPMARSQSGVVQDSFDMQFSSTSTLQPGDVIWFEVVDKDVSYNDPIASGSIVYEGQEQEQIITNSGSITIWFD